MDTEGLKARIDKLKQDQQNLITLAERQVVFMNGQIAALEELLKQNEE